MDLLNYSSKELQKLIDETENDYITAAKDGAKHTELSFIHSYLKELKEAWKIVNARERDSENK